MKYSISLIFFLNLIFPILGNSEESNSINLSIKTALDIALNHNRQILNVKDNVLKTSYQVDIAISEFDLQAKPKGDVGYIGGGSLGSGATVGTGIEFSKKFTAGTKILIAPQVLKANDKYRTNIKAIISQPLLRGFGTDYNLSSLHGAQFAMRSSIRNFHSSQCQLALRTIISLYELIKAQKNVDLNNESYQRVTKFYKAAIIKAKIGISDPLDVYRAELEMGQAEDALKSSQDRFQEAEDSLRDILALPSDTPLYVDVPLIYTPMIVPINEAFEIALINRVEIDQAEDQQLESYRLSKIAKDKLWPELNVVLNYSNLGEDQAFTYSYTRHRESSWGIGLTTSTDFNPAADQLAYNQSLLAIENSKRAIEQTEANIIFEIKKAIRHLDRTYERIEFQKEQINTSEGELKLSLLKFDRGMANNFDLIQAEKTHRSAQLSYWNAIIDHIIGEYQLRNVLGLLLEKPCL